MWVSMCVGMDVCGCGYVCRYGCMWVWVGVDVCGCLGELGKRDIFSDMIICITDIFF